MNKEYEKRYKKFKETIREEAKIISLIKENIYIDKNSKILDIGGNNGKISHGIQSKTENITIVDIKEIRINSKAKFIKNEWEKVNLKEKFDIILASHVLGYLGHEKSLDYSFNKMLDYLKPEGKLILCYNANTGFMKELINFAKEKLPSPKYDYFDKNLAKNLNKKERIFETVLKADNFEDLAELTHIFSLCPDEKFNKEKNKIENFLRKKLEKPEFSIEQKIMII